ncbi:hypothetical protein CIRG_07925 [Coccidioides immitis RMSCC 2394]|uniref:Uncharacterized protein n=1 Tax=Coccidioides immitis RMSCC 2394 TaxID=404692 RepID=A0A0J6YM70_COCIT|nr:hypothetical protein CIRG_07925 [Coccidioides immitis RMSCC 2394]
MLEVRVPGTDADGTRSRYPHISGWRRGAHALLRDRLRRSWCLYQIYTPCSIRNINTSKQSEPSAQDKVRDDSSSTCSANEENQATIVRGKEHESMSMIAKPSRYPQFPPLMNAYGHWNLMSMKTFSLCGSSKDECLFAIEMHTGYGCKGPLGPRPGLNLHNGTSRKDPIIAAAGDGSQWAARIYSFNVNSVILLPPLRPDAKTLATELMHGTITGDGRVTFHFSIEVSSGKKMRREKFEWRRMKEGDDDTKRSGFKLVRLFSNTREASSSNDNSNIGEEHPPSETFAVLEWIKGWSGFKQAFSLQLGNGQSDALGERWTLMVVMTALRIWYLRVCGKANKAVVGIGEKIRSK